MYLRTLLLLLLMGTLATFAIVNWNQFMTPTPLSLVFTTVEAPLGFVMLIMAGALTVMFLLFVVYLQTSVILDTRRYAREARAQKERAEHAETSRFTELHAFLEKRLGEIETSMDQWQEGMHNRVDLLDQDLKSSVEQAGNTLAAYIGELEDRLEKQGMEATKELDQKTKRESLPSPPMEWP